MIIGKSMKPVNTFKTKLRPLVGYIAVINLLLLTGCSSIQNEPVGQPSAAVYTPAEIKAAVKEPLQTSSGMTAGMMTQILAAELLLEKGLPAKAYELIYPLAEQTRDAGLVKHAFQLSMTTYQEAEIAKATQLWLDVEPDEPIPWRAAYLISLRQGDLNLAIEQWNQYRTLSKVDASEDILTSAQSVARSAKADIAMPFFEEVVAQNRGIWQSYYGYGVLASRYDQPQKAVELLQTSLGLLEKSDSNTELKQKAEQQIYQLLSQSYLQFDDPDIGLSVLKDYLKNRQDDWLVQERVARLEVKAQYLSAAESRYQTILNANPDANTSRLSLALLQIELEKFSQARVNLLQVTEEKAYETVGFYYLGVLSQEQNKAEEAIEFFNKVDAQPYVVDARLHIAEILFPSQGLEASMAVLDSIPATETDSQVKVLRAKAIFYRVDEQYQAAIDKYSEALNLTPNNVDMLLAQAALHYDLKQFSGYVKNLERVLSINPNSVDALNALGYYYVEESVSLDKATVLLERALLLAPDSYYILDSIGWLAYQKKDYQLAEKYLTKALAIEHDAEVLMHLIATRWQLGQQKQAKQLWQKHQLEFTKNKRYQTLIERLQSGTVIK